MNSGGKVKMYKLTSLRKFFKPTSVAVLIIVVFTGLASGQTTAHAVGNVTFKVVDGTDTAYGLETLAFFQRTLKIHKGDTVTWEFRGFHNVHFAQTLLAFLSVDDVNGKKVAEFNPAILFPNAKSGDPFKAGANSGVQVVINPTNPSFSLVM